VNVLIVDDHAIVRQGLKQILVESGKIKLIAEADSGAAAMRQIREGEWGVVVLDISLPDRNGIEVLKQIKKERPKIPVLMLYHQAKRPERINGGHQSGGLGTKIFDDEPGRGHGRQLRG
jgi:DNA-binding NarL/FixJ family response regulator